MTNTPFIISNAEDDSIHFNIPFDSVSLINSFSTSL